MVASLIAGWTLKIPSAATNVKLSPLFFEWAVLVSFWVITAQIAIDLLDYISIYLFHNNWIGSLSSRIVHFFHWNPVHAFALEWWVALFPVCFITGLRFRWKGVIYSLFGTIVFLVLIHNFRGFATRHNVFEMASFYEEWVSSGENVRGLPSPLQWDILYIFVCYLGSIVGAFSSRSKIDESTGRGTITVPPPTRMVGIASCTLILVAVLYSVFAFTIAKRQDMYPWFGSYTLGFASIVYAMAGTSMIVFRNQLEELFRG